MKFPLAALLLASASTQPLFAQSAPPPQMQADDADEIVVTGQRERGAVVSDIPPEIQLRPADIRALGASSVAEVLAAIAPQVGSARGANGPVILLAGRRISGFEEIRDLPSEAIARIDILPEEVALQYGYRPDQKVVNIVLRGRFRSVTAEATPSLATDGGRPEAKGSLGYLVIGQGSRFSLNGEYEHLTPLFEDERNIALSSGSLIDQRPFRTLLPESDRLLLNATVNRMLAGNVSATLNGRIEDTQTRAGIGATTALAPLTRDSANRSAHIGVALSGDLLPWHWSFTGTADRDRDRSETDTRFSAARDTARAVSQSLGADFVANGPLFDLPAGPVSTSLKGGFDFLGFDSAAMRSGVATGASLSRDTATVQASVDIPVASRRKAVLTGLGDLSFNLNVARDKVSDFGTLDTFGYGLSWSPVPILDLIVSHTQEEGAPSVQQLGNPLVSTPNVQVYDLSRGETVDITRVTGGNSFLNADNSRVLKLGATLKPLAKTDLTLRADFTRERVRNATASFPALSPAIEAAFPDRFVRDGAGRLVSVDARPVNFAQTASDQLRWGLNFSKPVGKAPPRPSDDVMAKLRQQFGNRQPPAGGAPGGAPREGGGRGPGGGGGFGGGGPGGGRAQLTLGLFHTWHFRESVLIAPGVPELDLLNGAGIGSRGGQPRHEMEAQAGFTKQGLGARLTANWSSGTTVRADAFGAASANDLRFSSLTTFNLRLFATPGARPQWLVDHPWLRGLRVRFSIDNLFNARPKVRDGLGAVPAGYEPDLLDPLGRRISVSIRKQFR